MSSSGSRPTRWASPRWPDPPGTRTSRFTTAPLSGVDLAGNVLAGLADAVVDREPRTCIAVPPGILAGAVTHRQAVPAVQQPGQQRRPRAPRARRGGDLLVGSRPDLVCVELLDADVGRHPPPGPLPAAPATPGSGDRPSPSDTKPHPFHRQPIDQGQKPDGLTAPVVPAGRARGGACTCGLWRWGRGGRARLAEKRMSRAQQDVAETSSSGRGRHTGPAIGPARPSSVTVVQRGMAQALLIQNLANGHEK